jgi:long-subunit acyl-CoA synthetase (AMP-forming)
MYDTLGPDAIRFIVNQTKLATIAVAKEYLQKLTDIKAKDSEGKMSSLENIVVFENEVSEAEK